MRFEEINNGSTGFDGALGAGGRGVAYAFATLARRLPSLQLAVPPEELRFKGESGIYGIKELPVTWAD